MHKHYPKIYLYMSMYKHIIYSCVIALVNTDDPTMLFLQAAPVDAITAVSLPNNEFLLVFSSKSTS
jgi:hypothetical protein